MSDDRRGLHPFIPELREQMRKGVLDRREFLRTATLLGMSAGAAYAMAGISPALAQAGATPRRGGTLRCSMLVQEMTDPATFDWTEKSNVARQMIEYLTVTGADNVTRPYLAESWQASDDLKTWTFKLRDGVTWSNGDKFGADDVVFNLKRWLDPKTGSSNIGLFAGMVDDVDTGKKDDKGNPVMAKRMREGSIEKIDDRTVRLHLASPTLSMPENFYNYPCGIVHRGFEDAGSNLAKNPIGTGPYTLVEHRVGERAVLRRRQTPYWGQQPFLDEIVYIDHGRERSAHVAALASGQVDMIYELDVSLLDLAERLPDVRIFEAPTAQTGVARMQVNQKPFDDKRVRQAILASMDHDRLLQLGHRGRGQPGEGHHVAPIHPDYFALPKMKQDHALAKKLLADAGHPNGIRIKIDVGNTSGPWELATVQAMKEQLAPAGITLDINLMPAAQYWEVWTKTPFGFTTWTHRPLGIMVLNLAYRSGVPWNETNYANPAFDAALDKASAMVDIEQRKKQMEVIETIMREDAPVVLPFWRSVMSAANRKVVGYRTHPTLYHQFNTVGFAA